MGKIARQNPGKLRPFSVIDLFSTDLFILAPPSHVRFLSVWSPDGSQDDLSTVDQDNTHLESVGLVSPQTFSAVASIWHGICLWPGHWLYCFE